MACDDALLRIVYGKAVSLAAEEIDYKGERVVDGRDKEMEWVELLGTEVKSVEIGGGNGTALRMCRGRLETRRPARQRA